MRDECHALAAAEWLKVTGAFTTVCDFRMRFLMAERLMCLFPEVTMAVVEPCMTSNAVASPSSEINRAIILVYCAMT